MKDEPQVEEPAEAAIPVPEKEAEEAESATAPESEGAEKPEDEKPKKPSGGFQRRIDELTRNWRDEQRRNDELTSILRQSLPQPVHKPDVAPTLEQYGYDEGKYTSAVAEFARQQARDEARTAIQREMANQHHAARTQSFKQREAEFASTVEDYADKVYDPTLPLTREVVELIADSDIGPRVAYYLADNPGIARSLADMAPVQAAREFGKIEAKLSTSACRKAVSQAPPPPPKIGAGEAEIDRDPDNMSTDEWLKWREKQLRKKR